MLRLIHCFLSLVLPGVGPPGNPSPVPPPAAAPQGEASAGALKELESGKVDAARLAAVLPDLGNSGVRDRVRAVLAEQKEFPRAPLVELLSHSRLAVRMGALEFLEEAAGGDSGYSPWLAADSPENQAALTRWKTWAGEKGAVLSGSTLSDGQRDSCLREILAGDADKSARARRMMESDGLTSLEFLETHLAEHPDLPEGARVRIREAEYQIVLARRFGPQAAGMARDLTAGSRDQMLAALGTLRGGGLEALPILRDYLSHSDPLVRETAVESVLVNGRDQGLESAAPLLAQEKDVNVIHGALRRIKDMPGAKSLKLATSFLSHPEEDLLVSALQTCQKLSGGSERSPFAREKAKVDPALRAAVMKLLDDPRWRVRAAALEFCAALPDKSTGDAVLKLLGDPDTFVRFAAIKAAVAMKLTAAREPMRKLYFADPAMIGPVVGGFSELGEALDKEMAAHLAAASPDVKIGALRVMSDSDTQQIAAFAADPDVDVACAALRKLAADEDNFEGTASELLLSALQGQDAVRLSAVLEGISLPDNDRLLPVSLQASAPAQPTSLDPLYDAFLKPLAAAQESGTPVGLPAAVAAVLKLASDTASPHAYTAAAALVNSGWTQGWGPLHALLPKLTTAQKVSAARTYKTPSGQDALKFFNALLADPVQEVREAAAAGMIKAAEDVRGFIPSVIPLLSAKAGVSPASLLNYSFRDSVVKSAAREGLLAWALETLRTTEAPGPQRILAALIVELVPAQEAIPLLVELGSAKSPMWQRRAAWHALGSQSGGISAHVDAVVADPDVPVRLVLPDLLSAARSTWVYQFDDIQKAPKQWYESGGRRSDKALISGVEKLAAADPSPLVRFQAMFALLTIQREVDLGVFIQLMSQQPAEYKARHQVADWLDDNASSAPVTLKPLLSAVDQSAISESNYATLMTRMGGGGKVSFRTFRDLVKTAAPVPAASAAEPVPGADPAPPKPETVVRNSLPVLFFHKPGCEECRRTRDLLDSLRNSFPGLTVTEHNIMEASATVLNQALCARFQVPSAQHTLTPAVFTQAGFAIRDAITPAEVGGLLERTTAISQDDAWMQLSTAEQTEAKQEVERRYDALTLSVVIVAGLLDGINPCAFATIIFFLSWLQIAKRTPREMLLTGAAFILAVFLAYLAAGLVLYQVLEKLSSFTWIQRWMNYVFAGFALFAAFLSFRDAWRAGAGRLDEMSLQLPGFLKNRIRSAIRTGVKARRFIIASFVTGLIVSLLELACTGQVYAPIVFQIQQGRGDAVLWLVLYNLAFILPLVVIFLLAWLGLRSEHLMNFQKRHTRTVKIGLGVLFLGLALLILFSDRLLH